MFKLQVHHAGKPVYSEEWDEPVQLGRAGDDEELCRKGNSDGVWRLPVAAPVDLEISGRHVLIEPNEGGLRLTNLSEKRAFVLNSGGVEERVAVGGSRQGLALPLFIRFGKSLTVVGLSEPDEVTFQPLAGEPMAIVGEGDPDLLAKVDPAALPGSRNDFFLRALQIVANLLRLAMGTEDFFAAVAQAVVDMIGLDRCLVLSREDDQLVQRAEARTHRRQRDVLGSPSTRVLKAVVEGKVTLWGDRGRPTSSFEALTNANVDAFVAAPILDQDGQVTGALYTDHRHEAGTTEAYRVAEAEARLVELIAQAVSVGLQRAEKDRAIRAERARFEQFFAPELARILPDRPELLAPKDAEVSVLFCDIRRFSRISERLRSTDSTAELHAWINDVMDTLSSCVLEHKGVLVDYIGDELMAMWGAPEEQPDHARRAGQAALDMLGCLPALNDRWQEKLGEPMGLGIGINSGPASVGNTGSRHKFKYGPLGHTVNLASRVQGATKYLKARLLVTDAARAGLGEEFAARKLCSVRVVNVTEPVVLHELPADPGSPWPLLKQEYETAYELFLNREFEAAAGTLGRLLRDHRTDGPSRVLLSRAVQWMNAEPEEIERFDEVWNLSGK